MRVGQNPAKFLDHVAQPKKVTVAVISYVPFLGGYYAHGLDLLKLCLGSLWENTDQPYDLLVFDNASCKEVRSFLVEAHEQGRIQYLVLSEVNLGKAGAWNFIFRAVPGEYIVYADHDVYFYPGWLSAQMDVLENIPQVGMVTGMPVRNPEKFSTSTVRWALEHPEAWLERGTLMPWEDFWRHVNSLGVGEDEARRLYSEGQDICLTYKGKKFYVGAAHFQFMSRRVVLERVLPIPSRRPMGEVRLLDIAINEQGYLRLCTPEYWVKHMGNTVPAEISGSPATNHNVPLREGGFKNWKLYKKLLLWVYKRSFDLLYRG